MGNIDLFRTTALRAGITPVVAMSASVHSFSMDFSLSGEASLRGNAQRLQELTDELTIAHRKIDIIDHQLYSHDLQLRRGHDVWVVQLPPRGDARTRQRGSGLQTRGNSTSRRRRGTGDDSD
ncbi:hypothetical protein GIB67_002129 [Kingdonia uniflora]|uniref:Uncharacterized protein n=1 Tax=Kingdonia uniflora TaxID=39325 RepID=A0A7J7KWM6_9MAGN|nr:hypothetical protein GIB67_002129 [Kingdonia uniflora]